jgi:hypothetical protein
MFAMIELSLFAISPVSKALLRAFIFFLAAVGG